MSPLQSHGGTDSKAVGFHGCTHRKTKDPKRNAAVLCPLQNQGFVVAWLVEHNTSADTRRSLRRSGCAVASKPLYASRMAPLLALATARNGIAHSNSNIDMPPLPSSMASSISR